MIGRMTSWSMAPIRLFSEMVKQDGQLAAEIWTRVLDWTVESSAKVPINTPALA